MQKIKIRLQIHDVLFFFLLVFSFYFTRNFICRAMMVLFFGYTIMRQLVNHKKMTVPYFLVGFLIFILYGAANIVIDNVIDEDVAQTMVISLMLNLLMMYAILQYILMEKDIVKILRITESGILTTTVVVVLLSLGTITEGRLGGGTEINANMLSMLCVYGFILTLYLRKIKKITLRSCAVREVVYLLSILLTGSRKGLIMVILALVIINLSGGSRKLVRGVLIGSVAAVALYVLIMRVEVLYNIIGNRVENLIILLTEGTTAEGSLKSRQELVQIGLMYFREKPWVGYGLDCFKMISGMGGSGNVSVGDIGYYSHNNYIELLFGAGIIGFILYYLPMLSLGKKLIKSIKQHPCVIYLFAIFVTKHVVEYAYVSYYSRIDAYILAVILGCLLLARQQHDTVGAQNPST